MLSVNDLNAAFIRALNRRRRPAGTLTEASARLGVTREHLSRVLHGHRQSASLTRRFRELEKAVVSNKPHTPKATHSNSTP